MSDLKRMKALYQLSLSIGNSLDLHQMLAESGAAFFEQMDATSLGVYQRIAAENGRFQLQEQYTKGHIERNSAYSTALEEADRLVAQGASDLTFVNQYEDSYQYGFDLPDYGIMIVLKEGEPLSAADMEGKRPLFHKLAIAATACLLEQQQNLLDESASLLSATLESTADGILVVDSQGTIIRANQQFAKMWQIPGEVLANSNEAMDLAFILDQLANPEQFISKVEALYANPEAESFDVLLFKDGRVFERISKPQRVDEKIAGRVWSFHDITKRTQVEKQMRQLATAIEQSLDGTAVADLEGNIQFANPAWARMHGYEVDEIIGQPLLIFHTEEQLIKEVAPFNKYVRETGSHQAEVGHKRKDGTTFPTWMTVVLLKDDEGIPVGLVADAQDITERKEAELLLRKEQEKTKLLLDAITIPMVVARVEDGSVVYANESMGELIRLPHMELLGQQTPNFYFDPADRGDLLVALNEKGYLENYELKLRRNDGELFWGEVSIRPFLYQDEPVLLTTLLDITTRKRVNAALEFSEKRYRTLFDAAADAIELIDAEGYLIDCNEVYLQALGYTRDEIIGKHITTVFTEKGTTLFKKLFARLKRDGYVDAETDLVRKDGSTLRVWRKARATYDDDNKLAGVVVYNRDITERQRIEAAIESHAANLEAVADVSAAISAILDVELLLQLVSDSIKAQFGLYHAHIFLMSDDGDAMELRAGAGEAGKALVAKKHRIALEHPHSLVAESVRTLKGVIVNDVTQVPDYMDNPYLPNTQAEMAIPILMGARVLGVLDLQADRVDYFSKEDLDIQTTLASQVAIALENARQNNETEEALSATKSLLAIMETASSELDLDMMLDNVLKQVLDATRFEFGLFSIIDLESGSLELFAHQLPEEWADGLRDGGMDGTLCDLVFRREQPILLMDITEDAPIDVSRMIEDGYRAYQGVPLMAHGVVVGTLCLFDTTVLEEQDAAIEWLSAVGQEIGFAIQNARLFEQANKTLDEMDILTRRLTREGWDTYTDIQDEMLSFAYDVGGVQEVDEGDADVVPATPYEQPLLVYGEKIGNLALFAHDDDEWDDEAAEIITAVATQLTARIENLRLTDETQRALSATEAQAKRLTTINQVAQVVSLESDIEKMLEATYNKVRNVMSVDSFFVGIYDKEAEVLNVPIAFENEFVEKGVVLPVTPGTKSYELIHSGEPSLHFLSEPVDEPLEDTFGDRSQPQTVSQLFIPLKSVSATIGVLSVQSYAQNAYDDSDVELMKGVASYVAVALENIRLFSETEERAKQLATINRVAQTISEQLDLEHMLEAVYKQLRYILSIDSFFISFYDEDSDTTEIPLIFEGDHRSSQGKTPLLDTSNTRKVLDSGKPVLRHITREEAESVYQESVRSGTGLGDYSKENTKSQLFVPMQSGQKVTGILSVQSYEYDMYTESDVALVMGIAQYLTVALENIRLFTDTQMRAAQLEKLSEIEGALSQAKSESEVIQALALFIGDEQAITLHYVEESEDETPVYAYTVAHWENGESHPDDPYLMKPFLIEQHAGTNIGLRHPNQVTFIADIEQDDRMDVAATAEAHHIGYGAVVIVPMRSAGRWQGFISLKWPQAHQFTDDELFLWNRLREPAAAVVAGRRAFMAQQGTLRETEALYEAGEKLNVAATYNEVLDVLREYTLVGSGAQNVSLNYFSEAWVGDKMPEEVYVLARRTAVSTEGTFQYTAPRYRLRDFPSVQMLIQRDVAILIEDVKTDPRFDENVRTLYMETFGAVSTIFVPLVAGGQWFGYINAIYHQAMEFPEVEVRRLMALAGQAAVSIQSIRLLDETTKRAEREQTLRQITERVRSAVNVETVLQTAVQELSRALGRRAFIQLSSDTTGEAEHEQ